MRSILCLGLLFVSLAFALDVDSLPVWDPAILENVVRVSENSDGRADLSGTDVSKNSDSSHAEIETHGYKTMQLPHINMLYLMMKMITFRIKQNYIRVCNDVLSESCNRYVCLSSNNLIDD